MAYNLTTNFFCSSFVLMSLNQIHSKRDIYFSKENTMGLPPVPFHSHSPFPIFSWKISDIPLKANLRNAKINMKKINCVFA